MYYLVWKNRQQGLYKDVCFMYQIIFCTMHARFFLPQSNQFANNPFEINQTQLGTYHLAIYDTYQLLSTTGMQRRTVASLKNDSFCSPGNSINLGL